MVTGSKRASIEELAGESLSFPAFSMKCLGGAMADAYLASNLVDALTSPQTILDALFKATLIRGRPSER